MRALALPAHPCTRFWDRLFPGWPVQYRRRVGSVNVAVGLALIGVIDDRLTLAGVAAYCQLAVKGSIILAAVVYHEPRHATQGHTR